KADAHCAVVAAASVIAKVYRDQLMCELEDPGYGFASHKGHGAAAHLDALREMGPCEHHRRSWRLPGVEAPVPGEAIAPEVAVEPPSPMVPATAGSRPVA
nr:hypothetical protein [Actinomycetales bacterium]